LKARSRSLCLRTLLAAVLATVVRVPLGFAAPEAPAVYDGLLLPGRTALIKSKYNERIAATPVRPGATVKKGQLVLRLVGDEQTARKTRAEAVVEGIRSRLERLRKVHESQGVSEQALEQAETELKIAQADFDMARIQLEERSIVAPFDGVLAERYVDAGASVEVGDPLLRITALSPLRVEALLPQEALPALRRIGLVEVRLSFPDTVLQVPVGIQSIVVDPASGAFPLQIEIDNTARRLTPGVSCRVTLPGAATAVARVRDGRKP
jgi:RND family efflux transporter MFP subunit